MVGESFDIRHVYSERVCVCQQQQRPGGVLTDVRAQIPFGKRTKKQTSDNVSVEHNTAALTNRTDRPRTIFRSLKVDGDCGGVGRQVPYPLSTRRINFNGGAMDGIWSVDRRENARRHESAGNGTRDYRQRPLVPADDDIVFSTFR